MRRTVPKRECRRRLTCGWAKLMRAITLQVGRRLLPTFRVNAHVVIGKRRVLSQSSILGVKSENLVSTIYNLMTYRYQNSRKSNFATEHGGNPRQHVRDTYGCE